MDNSVAVTLFRHGITEANHRRQYLGWRDSPITHEAGRTLRALQSENSIPDYDICLSSDLTRCRQTAAILCPNRESIESKAFREMNFGQWELKTYGELCHDAVYQDWLDDPFSKRPPDGESFAEMGKRVMSGWQSLRQMVDEQGYREILVVTHGGVIRFLLTRFANEMKRFWQWQILHGSGVRLSWTNRDWKEDSRCTSLQAVPSMENENG